MKRWDKTLHGTECPACNGTGSVTMSPDAHRSGGTVPCPRAYFTGHGWPVCVNGTLVFSDYDLERWP